VNIILITKDYYENKDYTYFKEKAFGIAERTGEKGKMYMSKYEDKIIMKLRQGKKIYSMTNCGTKERYSEVSESCIPCGSETFTYGLQAEECIQCADFYSELRDPDTKDFSYAVYSKAC
jgi:hypothetical protein